MGNTILKRSFDILFAATLLLLISPLFLLICLILLITEKGKVFYFQDRMGKGGKPFRIWKFTTMVEGSEKMGNGTITLRNDWRVTRVGHILRLSKLNEFPQLINVLKGDMSVVGPRPLVPADFAHYSEEAKKAIGKVKPGLTGAGSIVFRDEQYFVTYAGQEPKQFYKNIIMPYKGEVEKWYSEHHNFINDLKLIWLTAISIIHPTNLFIHKWFNHFPPRPEELTYKWLRAQMGQTEEQGQE